METSVGSDWEAYHSAAAFSYDTHHHLIKELVVQPKYEDQKEFPLCLHKNRYRQIWVPRQMVPRPNFKASNMDAGTDALFANDFEARNSEQIRMVDESVKLLKMGVDHILQAPTGFGKTYLGVAIASRMGRRTLIITTKEDCLDDWQEATWNVLGQEAGVWRGDSVPSNDTQVVVGLVQSVMKGYSRYGREPYDNFGLVICDEVHRMAAERFSEAMWYLPARHRLGLSATPYRKDGRDPVFRGHIGEVRVTTKMETLIPKIVIQHTGVKVPSVIPHRMGRLGAVLKWLMKNQTRNDYICSFVNSCVNKGRNTIVFSEYLDHLKLIEGMLISNGMMPENIGYYVGIQNYPHKTKVERKQAREDAKYKPVILATYAMASEATNIPWLSAAVMATPRSDVKQILGRIRREYPDKPQPIVLDLVDSGSMVLDIYAKNRQRLYASWGSETVAY